MHFIRSKAPAVIVLCGIVLMFAGTLIAVRLFSKSFDVYLSPSTIIEGEYSVDGGPWTRTDFEKPINDHFHKIVFRGRLLFGAKIFREVDIAFKNVWISLKEKDGELLYSNQYRIEGSEVWNMTAEDYDTKEAFLEAMNDFLSDMPLGRRMPHTPGYEHISLIPAEDLRDSIDKELILTVENPYNAYSAFSKCVFFTLSAGNGAYLRAARETLLSSLLFLLICFFGVFLFPTISFIFGKINYKYLTFGFLCFFWGVFMLLYLQSRSLNTSIPDPVLCMMIERMSVYCFFSSLIVYFRANLKQAVSRAIAGVAVLIYLIAALAAVVLQLAAVCDLTALSPWNNLLMGVITLLFTGLLVREARTDRGVLRYLLSLIPLAVTLLIDIADQFLSLAGEDYFIFGFILTLATQIVQLFFDLRRQYRAALRYPLIQKELYEAQVAVMASQIRPHFMYNALTSIAMMCTIDPPTAQEATITFAKYLRENMDSLKQNKPVPFQQEFEHLKKYLYIEKLRFQDKLNIEYDIEVTDFVLPLLTVQPLVENAVKHGVGMKKKGGTVKISTRETESAYEVIIADDGVGFDPSVQKADDGRSHVGMETTRTRLREMCGGEIRIESTVGEGTTATLILPKEGQKE